MLAPSFSSFEGRNVFLSFVPQREKALRRSLAEALIPLSRRGLITLWSDDEIQGGQQREKEISQRLQAAHIILLLVSPACMASSEWNEQVSVIMAREKSPGVWIVPVLLRPTVDWQDTLFGHLAPLPADGKPIVAFSQRDEAWFKVAEGIWTLLTHMGSYTPLAIPRRRRRRIRRIVFHVHRW
jgi:TIR domain-containing protein